MKREPTKQPTTLKFTPAARMMPPPGAVTYTGGGNKPAKSKERSMPRDVPSTMPSNIMFTRVRERAANISPNPAERVEGRAYPGPGRFVGNFSDRSTPHGILRVRTVNEDPTKGA